MGHGPRVVCPFIFPCSAASVNQKLPQFCRTRSSAEALRSNDTVSAEGHFNRVSKAMYPDKKKGKGGINIRCESRQIEPPTSGDKGLKYNKIAMPITRDTKTRVVGTIPPGNIYLSMGCLSTQLLGLRCLFNISECPYIQRTHPTKSFPRPEAFRRKRTWDQDQTEIEEPTLHHLVTVIIKRFRWARLRGCSCWTATELSVEGGSNLSLAHQVFDVGLAQPNAMPAQGTRTSTWTSSRPCRPAPPQPQVDFVQLINPTSSSSGAQTSEALKIDTVTAAEGGGASWRPAAPRARPLQLSRNPRNTVTRQQPPIAISLPMFDNCEVTIIVSGAMHRAKKAKVEPSSALRSDKFSSLPQEIKVTILSKLNSLDAIRASILSSAWRNVWTTLPEIYLCDLYLSWGSSETTQRSNFITLVDLALLLHNGPLASFSILGFKRYHDVFDRWMYMLSRKKPRSITIKFYSGHNYKIPSNLFSLSDLEYLQIKRCIIGLPQEFEGFKRLTVLNLKYFSSTDSDINNLISSCPLLSTLCLKYFEGITCLSIQAPALQDLEVKGNFQDFHLHAPNLSNLDVSLDKTEAQQSVVVEGNRKNYLKQAMVSLTSIVRLVMKRCIIALPQEFEGFKQLFVLNLKYFSSTDHDINTLVSSCPWLNTLRLKHFDGISCLRIEGQVLQIVEVEGKFEDFHLNAPNLSHVYITLDKTEAQQSVAVVGDMKNYMKQAFVSLTSIEELTISGSFLTYLPKGCLSMQLPGVFDHLKKICIEKCFWNWTEVLGACSIFQNAPTFRELEIWSFPRPEAYRRKTIWDQDQTEIEEPTLHHLVTVAINDFVGLNCEVALVGLLLSWSPALEDLKIFRAKNVNDEYMCICKGLTKLLALPRASSKAKITVI
uniref:F-box domain-containing protein n=1 Tax=Oryza rufipogon TaxID=4529 RepID=A0A0E0NG12_ORYRU